MDRFRQGIFVGVLLSVLLTLALALTLDDERRRQLRYRLEKLRGALPKMEQMKQSVQETVTRAREMGSHPGNQVQESADKQAQEILSAVQQPGASLESE